MVCYSLESVTKASSNQSNALRHKVPSTAERQEGLHRVMRCPGTSLQLDQIIVHEGLANQGYWHMLQRISAEQFLMRIDAAAPMADSERVVLERSKQNVAALVYR